MNGEKTEYRVEFFTEGEWKGASSVTDLLPEAEQSLETFRSNNPTYQFRLAVRTVSDWCEAQEGGESCR